MGFNKHTGERRINYQQDERRRTRAVDSSIKEMVESLTHVNKEVEELRGTV